MAFGFSVIQKRLAAARLKSLRSLRTSTTRFIKPPLQSAKTLKPFPIRSARIIPLPKTPKSCPPTRSKRSSLSVKFKPRILKPFVPGTGIIFKPPVTVKPRPVKSKPVSRVFKHGKIVQHSGTSVIVKIPMLPLVKSKSNIPTRASGQTANTNVFFPNRLKNVAIGEEEKATKMNRLLIFGGIGLALFFAFR